MCNLSLLSCVYLHNLGHLVTHVRMGHEILKLAKSFPTLSLAASIQPITRTVLKVHLTITPDFEWNDRLHGSTSDPWWIWVEDAENNEMYHSEYFLLQKKHVSIPADSLLQCSGINMGRAGNEQDQLPSCLFANEVSIDHNNMTSY